jgi:hypoxanthine phosphoribosyltransferase
MDEAMRPSWEDIHTMTKNVSTQVLSLALGPDYVQELTRMVQTIVGVTRGGLIPAIILSHELGLPMCCADYSSRDGAGDDKRTTVCGELPDLPYGAPLLIVDDIADTGRTLFELWSEYTERGHIVHTATLYYKSGGEFKPTFYAEEIPANAPWVVFPWE